MPMTCRPLDFHLVPSSAELVPLQDEWLRSAERELGVSLPRKLVQLLRLQNGGQLRYDTHAANIDDRDHVSIHSLRGIGPSERDGLRFNHYFLDEWELDPALVLLDGNGHEWIALDYRCSATEPSACWVDADNSRTVELAPKFEVFLDGLRRGDGWVCFGFAQSVTEVASHITSVLGLRFADSRLVTGTLVAHHPLWRDEFGEPAEVHIEQNNPCFVNGFPEHPTYSTIVRVSLLAESRPALATAMAG